MARWGEATWGDFRWGHYPPTTAHARGGYQAVRIRNALTGILNPTVPIVESASVSQEFGVSGFARASVACINPSGANSAVYAEGDLIRIEVAVSSPGGGSYVADLGRFRVRAPAVGAVAGSARWTLTLDCVSELEERLRFPVSGDLPALAATDARRFGLLGPDNTTASIPGIAAYLLLTGGITAVRATPPTVNMQAYIEAVDDGYSGPWNLSPQQSAYRVLGTLEAAGGFYTYVDIDGTGVIAGLPRAITDLQGAARTWAGSGTDAVTDRLQRKTATPITQVQVTNQTSAGTDRIVFTMSPGDSAPVEATIDPTLSTRNFNTASYPPRADDPSDGQETRARQYAFEESLRAIGVTARAYGDPGLWAGDVIDFDFASHGAEGDHLLRRVTHTYPARGIPRLEVLAQPFG